MKYCPLCGCTEDTCACEIFNGEVTGKTMAQQFEEWDGDTVKPGVFFMGKKTLKQVMHDWSDDEITTEVPRKNFLRRLWDKLNRR